jgi:hypothetical protein
VYCPKCGVKNLEDAKFCRACGADLHLVPQALKGKLPDGVVEVEEHEQGGRRERKYKFKEPPTLEKAMENFFGGIALLLVFVLGYFYYQGAFLIWVWFIIPGLEHIGKGIGQAIRARRERPALAAPRTPDGLPPFAPRELSAPATSEIAPPPASVTESTTRSLAGRR